MLSPIVYRLLAKASIVDSMTLRIFIHLMSEYDLREFTVINLATFTRQYKCKPVWVEDRIDELAKLGILERGPKITGGSKQSSTYRIRRQFLLTESALKRHYQDLRERNERAMLLT